MAYFFDVFPEKPSVGKKKVGPPPHAWPVGRCCGGPWCGGLWTNAVGLWTDAVVGCGVVGHGPMLWWAMDKCCGGLWTNAVGQCCGGLWTNAVVGYGPMLWWAMDQCCGGLWTNAVVGCGPMLWWAMDNVAVGCFFLGMNFPALSILLHYCWPSHLWLFLCDRDSWLEMPCFA